MKKGKRAYVLKARGEKLAATRARITEAIMNLHQEVGPRAATVSAIARRAGVERLTVYRHFRGPEEMLAACSGLFLERNPPPQASAWPREEDAVTRAEHGLKELYDYYRRTAEMFEKVYRDVNDHPGLDKLVAGFDGHLRSLADELVESWPGGPERERCRIILRHAVRFATWQSLEAERVTNGRKAALIGAWLARAPSAERERAMPDGGTD